MLRLTLCVIVASVTRLSRRWYRVHFYWQELAVGSHASRTPLFSFAGTWAEVREEIDCVFAEHPHTATA